MKAKSIKKMLVILLCFVAPVCALALDYTQWPSDSVVALMGASGANEASPIESPFAGYHIGGGSYTDLGESMTTIDMQVINAGQAGAYSFDIPGTGWYGYTTQLVNSLAGGAAADGQHIKAAVFDPMNDCLHSQPCGEIGQTNYISNLSSAVDMAIANNLKVVVMQLMPFERLDIYRAVHDFGITYTISADDYAALVAKHEAAFSGRTDIIYLDAYSDVITIDGLHPDAASMKKAAHMVKQALKEVM